MDILQRKHAFDQLENWLGQVKESFVERYSDEPDEEIDRLNDEKSELESKVEYLEEKVNDLESDVSDLEDQIKKAREILEEINSTDPDELSSKIDDALSALE